MRRACVFFIFACGCGVRELPPPEAPAAVVPSIPDGPDAPPEEGAGRLLLETVDEPAKVERVTERTEPPNGMGTYGVKTELVCITPCAVDGPTGAVSLVFTSLEDPTKKGTADVRVARGTTVVRHHLGVET